MTAPVVLAISTSTPAVSVALIAGDRGVSSTVCAVARDRQERRHVEALVPMLATVLRDAGLSLDDLTHVAVDVGPGLFTGIRVGVVSAATLAASRRLRVVPVSSIAALRASVAGDGEQAWVAVDGRRGDVFLAPVGARADSRSAEFEVVPFARALDQLAATGARVVVGDGALPLLVAAEAGDRVVEWTSGGADQLFPDATLVGSLAYEALIAGSTEGVDAADVRPIYGREADAVANFRTRQQP